uniref:Uncharacterized protein n=1 Tax=Meloidogyne incognita TaxID=6306 RepID=A0A914MDR6_MELIC
MTSKANSVSSRRNNSNRKRFRRFRRNIASNLMDERQQKQFHQHPERDRPIPSVFEEKHF